MQLETATALSATEEVPGRAELFELAAAEAVRLVKQRMVPRLPVQGKEDPNYRLRYRYSNLAGSLHLIKCSTHSSRKVTAALLRP